MPTCSSRSPARVSASLPETFSCACIMSTNWSPTRVTGLSEFIALWKTIEMWRQRNRRSSSLLLPIRSSPRKITRPLAITAGGRRICIAAFATVLLPQPDSPARPTISPASIFRLSPATARQQSGPVPYSTTRSRSSSSVSRPVAGSAGETGSATAVTSLPSGPRAARRRARRTCGATVSRCARRAGAGC